MNKIYAILIILSFFISCQSENNIKNCKYADYKYYRLYKNDFDIDRITYKTIISEIETDSIIRFKIIEDSTYFPKNEESEISKSENELLININSSNLSKSFLKVDNSDIFGNFKLTLIKKQKIDNKFYNIYRFDHDFDGEDGQNAIFFTKEFGIVMEFNYDKGNMSRLIGIEDFGNKDYLILTEKMLDDSVFLYTPRYDL